MGESSAQGALKRKAETEADDQPVSKSIQKRKAREATLTNYDRQRDKVLTADRVARAAAQKNMRKDPEYLALDAEEQKTAELACDGSKY
jgi:hypothetical protein